MKREIDGDVKLQVSACAILRGSEILIRSDVLVICMQHKKRCRDFLCLIVMLLIINIFSGIFTRQQIVTHEQRDDLKQDSKSQTNHTYDKEFEIHMKTFLFIQSHLFYIAFLSYIVCLMSNNVVFYKMLYNLCGKTDWSHVLDVMILKVLPLGIILWFSIIVTLFWLEMLLRIFIDPIMLFSIVNLIIVILFMLFAVEFVAWYSFTSAVFLIKYSPRY